MPELIEKPDLARGAELNGGTAPDTIRHRIAGTWLKVFNGNHHYNDQRHSHHCQQVPGHIPAEKAGLELLLQAIGTGDPGDLTRIADSIDVKIRLFPT